MVETAQGHDKETTPGPVKATKRIKKLKASKHNLGTQILEQLKVCCC